MNKQLSRGFWNIWRPEEWILYDNAANIFHKQMYVIGDIFLSIMLDLQHFWAADHCREIYKQIFILVQ